MNLFYTSVYYIILYYIGLAGRRARQGLWRTAETTGWPEKAKADRRTGLQGALAAERIRQGCTIIVYLKL